MFERDVRGKRPDEYYQQEYKLFLQMKERGLMKWRSPSEVYTTKKGHQLGIKILQDLGPAKASLVLFTLLSLWYEYTFDKDSAILSEEGKKRFRNRLLYADIHKLYRIVAELFA